MKHYKYPDAKQIIVSGDIHGDFKTLVFKLCIQYGCTDTWNLKKYKLVSSAVLTYSVALMFPIISMLAQLTGAENGGGFV